MVQNTHISMIVTAMCMILLLGEKLVMKWPSIAAHYLTPFLSVFFHLHGGAFVIFKLTHRAHIKLLGKFRLRNVSKDALHTEKSIESSAYVGLFAN